MLGNTEEDIIKIDHFNAFMVEKKIFIKDILGQVIMNPDPVYVGSEGQKVLYTLEMALADYKKAYGK